MKFQYGAKSNDNAELQRRLGFTGDDVDGIFGTETRDAVYGYQQKNGLPPTGTVDSRTEAKLFPEIIPPAEGNTMFKGMNWANGLVFTTILKYVLSAASQYLAVKFGVDQGTTYGILFEIATGLFAYWGTHSAAQQKLVIDGTKVLAKNLPPSDLATVKSIVRNNS